MTTSSSTPSEAITSRLIANESSSRGSASGWITASGWGSKVSTVSAPRMTSRWPRCTPSKVPTATRRCRGCASGRGVTFTARTLRGGAPPCALGHRHEPSLVGQAHRRAARAPVPSRAARASPRGRTRSASASSSSRAGRKESASASGTIAPLGIGSRLEREGTDPACARAPRSRRRPSAGHELAHVGPGRALDLEPHPLPLAPAALEAVDVHRALGPLDRIAAPRALVEALAVDLDRRVGRRALAELADGQRELGSGTRPVCSSAPSRSPGVRRGARGVRPPGRSWAGP